MRERSREAKIYRGFLDYCFSLGHTSKDIMEFQYWCDWSYQHWYRSRYK